MGTRLPPPSLPLRDRFHGDRPLKNPTRREASEEARRPPEELQERRSERGLAERGPAEKQQGSREVGVIGAPGLRPQTRAQHAARATCTARSVLAGHGPGPVGAGRGGAGQPLPFDLRVSGLSSSLRQPTILNPPSFPFNSVLFSVGQTFGTVSKTARRLGTPALLLHRESRHCALELGLNLRNRQPPGMFPLWRSYNSQTFELLLNSLDLGRTIPTTALRMERLTSEC